MRRLARFILIVAVLGAGLFATINPTTPVKAGGGWVFIHTVTTANLEGNATRVDSSPIPLDVTSYTLFVTANWNPGGKAQGIYHNHPIGIGIDGRTGQFYIFNRDGAPMSVGLTFNVVVMGNIATFTASADESTIPSGTNYFLINNIALNNQPNVIPLFSPLYVRDGSLGPKHGFTAKTLGLWYESQSMRWGIFNEDSLPMAGGLRFALATLTPPTGFVHRATVSNIVGNYTVIDSPMTNGRPNAVIVVSHVWNANGSAGVYHNHEVGLYYDTNRAKWAIFNQDLTPMPVDVAFSVYAAGDAIEAAPTLVAAVTVCPPSLPARLVVGAVGKVTAGEANSLNSQAAPPGRDPNSTRVALIPGGGAFTVIGGPVCAWGYRWWQVNYNGAIGWTAEGENTTYWLELVSLPPTPTPSPLSGANVGVCPPALPSRLQIGIKARVTPGDPNALNTQPAPATKDPASKRLAPIPGGGIFRVIGGPVCAWGYRWWQVDYNGTIGWTAEGENTTYWLEPIN